MYKVETGVVKAIVRRISGQAFVCGWHVGITEREEMRANDNIRRPADGDGIFKGFEQALIVIIRPIDPADDLPFAGRADENRGAGLMELWRGWVKRVTSGHVYEKLVHECSVVFRAKEGAEGGTGVEQIDVAEGGSQRASKAVEEATNVGRIVVSAVDDHVAAVVRDVVMSCERTLPAVLNAAAVKV